MDNRDFITKIESKRSIMQEWNKWKKPDPDKATYGVKLAFYEWLKNNRPDLLQWKLRHMMTQLDRWQEVQGWLNERTKTGKTR